MILEHKKKNAHLDILSIIATISFVLIGITDILILSRNLIPNELWWLANIGEGLFRTSMPILLMSIGAILLNENEDPFFEFFKMKLFKAIICYLIWSLLYIVLDARINNVDITIKLIFDSIKGFSGYYHMWIFQPLLLIYFIMPIARRVFFNVENQFFIYVIIGWITVIASGLIIERIIGISFISTSMINISYFAYCILGYIINEILSDKYKKPFLFLIMFIVGVIVTTYFINSTYNFELNKINIYYYNPFSVNIILTVVGLFGFINSIKFKNRKYKFIKIMSTLSLGVILINPFVILVFKLNFNLNLLDQPNLKTYLIISVGSIVISYLVSYFLNKLPFVKEYI